MVRVIAVFLVIALFTAIWAVSAIIFGIYFLSFSELSAIEYFGLPATILGPVLLIRRRQRIAQSLGFDNVAHEYWKDHLQ
ncbi:MAG: hypothetical protein HY243_14045 [Proteobacteria bacterium]|nr:hypothetical protein [Pseudomonadota bacterium]